MDLIKTNEQQQHHRQKKRKTKRKEKRCGGAERRAGRAQPAARLCGTATRTANRLRLFIAGRRSAAFPFGQRPGPSRTCRDAGLCRGAPLRTRTLRSPRPAAGGGSSPSSARALRLPAAPSPPSAGRRRPSLRGPTLRVPGAAAVRGGRRGAVRCGEVTPAAREQPRVGRCGGRRAHGAARAARGSEGVQWGRGGRDPRLTAGLGVT